jgi:hypothetical protein
MLRVVGKVGICGVWGKWVYAGTKQGHYSARVMANIPSSGVVGDAECVEVRAAAVLVWISAAALLVWISGTREAHASATSPVETEAAVLLPYHLACSAYFPMSFLTSTHYRFPLLSGGIHVSL